MFDNKKELLDKIRLGEDSFLEFKEIRFSGSRITEPNRKTLADEISAFANGRGGVILLGVQDRTHEILGISIDRLDDVEKFLFEVCHDSVNPPLAPVIERIELPDSSGIERPLMKVDIESSLFVHESRGRYLHRVGSSVRHMQPEFLTRLMQERSQTGLIRFDEQTVDSSEVSNLDSELVLRFHSRLPNVELPELTSNLGLVRTASDGLRKPTVAGVLMASQNPTQWLPNAYIQAVAYRGKEIKVEDSDDPYQIDAAGFVGPLDSQVADACEFVYKNMRTPAVKSIGRRESPQFDMLAVFEALVNAVAHRDYSIWGSKIRLRLFEDRLEIYSPGALPNTLRVEDLLFRQSSRNEVLTSLLAKCRVPERDWISTHRGFMMDKRGEGVRVIFDNSERLSGKKPRYRVIGESEVQLTIFS